MSKHFNSIVSIVLHDARNSLEATDSDSHIQHEILCYLEGTTDNGWFGARFEREPLEKHFLARFKPATFQRAMRRLLDRRHIIEHEEPGQPTSYSLNVVSLLGKERAEKYARDAEEVAKYLRSGGSYNPAVPDP